MTVRLYRDDPYLLEFDAVVVARRTHDGKPAVVLDRTAFYAESGGQPWDVGTLDGAPVVAVVESGGDVLHVLGGTLAADNVHGRVDGDRRRDHREQHHGQHLLSRAFVDVAGARTVSFHLGVDTTSIDLDREVTSDHVREAERRTNEIVWEARPVTVRTLTREEAQAAGVVVPPEAGERVRLVDAQGFDLQACGGTHPRSTSEVGVVLVLGHERYKGGTRVRFVCGHRALAAVRERTAALDRVGALLSAPLGQIAAATQKLLDQAAAAERRVRALTEAAIESEARSLLARADARPALVSSTYDGWPAADLRALAQRLVALAPCVALLGSRLDTAHVVFAQSDGLGHDVPALLRHAMTLLDGRGGGQGNMAQGGGPRLDRLEEALATAAAAIRSR